MHRHLRLPSFAVVSLVLVGALVGCGSSAEEQTPVEHPAPSEATVFDASAETKKEVGIEKWGFDSKSDGDEVVYRGYGAHNEVIQEVARKLDRSNEDRWVMTLEAKGAQGSAKERVEFTLKTNDKGDTEIYAMVTENTFEEGKGPMNVMMRFKADGAAFAADDGLSGGGALVSGAGDELVQRCQELASRCNRLLIRDEIAANAQSGECGLLKTVGVPLLGGVIGAAAGVWVGGVGAVPGAAIGVVSGAGTQAALCLEAQIAARRARAEFQACQNEQRRAGCTVTR